MPTRSFASARSRCDTKALDTPGIEPGAFRLQSGRATTAICARNMNTFTDTFFTALLRHTCVIRSPTRCYRSWQSIPTS